MGPPNVRGAVWSLGRMWCNALLARPLPYTSPEVMLYTTRAIHYTKIHLKMEPESTFVVQTSALFNVMSKLSALMWVELVSTSYPLEYGV